jgi:porphobilinogen deaminase
MDYLSIKVGIDRRLEVRTSFNPEADVIFIEQEADLVIVSIKDVPKLIKALSDVALYADTHKVKQ